MTTGPDVPPRGDSRAQRRAFRDFVRSHHPDLGGDPAHFVAGLAAWRPVRATPTQQLQFHRRRRGLRGAADAWRACRARRRAPSRVR